jgi:kynureninase
MAPSFAPIDGIGRALCGTQPIVSLALVECGLEVFEETGMDAIRAKSLALTDLFIELVEARCGGHPLGLVTPREHARRGSQVSFTHPHGYAVMAALIARGVIGDYRAPDILRFGLAALYVGFVDIWNAVAELKDVMAAKAWKAPEFAQRKAVT